MRNKILKTIGSFINIISYFSPRSAAKVSLNIFSMPRKGKIDSIQSEFLNTAFKEELEFEDLSVMTYRWKGKNKTILLAHGWESNAFRWKTLIGELQKRDHEVVALDAPAHGNSGSKYFNALLYSEFITVVSNKFNPEAIIGHSVGGMSTVFSQFNNPQNQLKKLILLGSPAHFNGVLQRYVNMMGYNDEVHHTIKSIVYERYDHDTSYWSTAVFTKTINAEGLIIHDKTDPIIPYEDALLISSNFQNSELILTSGFGHSLNHQTIHNYILEFING